MSQQDAKQKWKELQAEILRRCEEIDQLTPWSETEPAWWLQMMEVRRAAAPTDQ